MKKLQENPLTEVIAPWTYNGSDVVLVPEKTMGFVYLLTHIPTGRQYVGKKLFWFSATKQVKLKKKKIKVESDWKKYYSSCLEIMESVKEKGTSEWKREILHYAKTKGTLNYLEAREQMDRRVLENPDKYINGIISCRVHWTHVKIT
jgi:hypothetical protein